MVQIEIWEQRSSAEEDISTDEDIRENRLPLFDRLLPSTGKAKPKPQPPSTTESETTSESETVSESDTETVESESPDATSGDTSDDYEDDWRRLQSVRAKNSLNPATYGDWQALPRAWDSVFYISSMHNLENTEQNYFYCIRVQHVNERISKASGLGNITMYTPKFTLKPGEDLKLPAPLFIWRKRRLKLPYGQLQHYVIEIELWKTHLMRINSLHASQRITFQEIIDRNSNINITLNMHIPSQVNQTSAGNGAVSEVSERRFPVHKISAFLLLEEVFDFFFVFENWWFTMSPELPDAVKALPKTLKISVPSAMGSSCQHRTTHPSDAAYWASPGTFRFQGTLRQLRYASFTAKVFCVTRTGFFAKPPALLGTCVLSLKSVQELPLVRGVVKKLTLGTRNMFSGTIQGNIRCCVKSATINFFEDLRSRPAQPITGSALITQLDHRCHYLVVRVISCASLPASNTDSNTSDPMVKVKWDGIVNCTGVVESTVSPIYNQNMYFPIHLVDKRELIDPALIKHSLPIDMSSKGPVTVEVWDHDETSSEFLGSVDVPLSKLYTNGVLQKRSLVDGIFTTGSYDPELDDEDISEDDSGATYTGDSASSAPYRRHTTRLYEATLPLTGATVAHRGKKPTVSVQMYILPPMPNDLYIPHEEKKTMRTDIYRDLSRRWTKDFDAWQVSYCDRYPGAINRRRFTSVTNCAANVHEDVQSDLLPLCCFVKPIQVYIQLSPPGELMHWISNFTYKEDGMKTVGTRQLIDTWQMPSRFVLTRKGGLHDRSLLLCSCLLGLGYDAYVCKGTLQNGTKEHCWVMTRHSDGTVTFWETANKRMWHLPKRWRTQEPVQQPNKDVVGQTNNYAMIKPQQPTIAQTQHQRINYASTQRKHPRRLMDYEIYGKDYVADVKVDLHNIFSGNEFVADGNVTMPKQTAFLVEQHQLETAVLRRSTFDPKAHLLIPGKTLVHVPYCTLEVVFNDKQVWGNLQCQHPGCITYDLDCANEWKPFLQAPPNNTIMPDVQITAPAPQAACAATAREIHTDIVEMIELMYAQHGRVANVSRDQQMDERLEALIDLLEFRQRLDPQFDPGMPLHLRGWSAKRNAKVKSSEPVRKPANTDNSIQKSVPTTVSGHVGGGDKAKLDQMRSVMETANVLAEGAKEKELAEPDNHGSDSDETTASTDDSIEFDPATAAAPRSTQSINRKTNQNTPPPQKKRWGIKLGDKLKAILHHAPRHHAMFDEDAISRIQKTTKPKWNVRLSSFGFRLRKTPLKIKEPQMDILKVLSNASEHFDASNFEELSDYRYEVKSGGIDIDDMDGALTPMSDIANITTELPWNHPLSDYKQRINSAIHLKAPLVNAKTAPKQPLGRVAQGNRLRVSNRKQSILKKLIQRLKHNEVPDVHKVPQFMADMQSVIKQTNGPTHFMEHSGPIPTEFLLHESKQISKWSWYYNMEARQFAWRRHLPIPHNHTFIGVPIHFCTSDINEIRHLLHCSKRCKKLLVPKVDRCVNVVYVKVFPLLGGVFSTWIFLGCHVPWNIH
ncbi:C2 domain-containing protein, putative [Babesia ovis]|uniref:C2 domain-containing protein, putative n=1 Tax=Babesia ovis TaxID=5869 RepID=A0A9W5TBB8_BABOV|nr:C2 domain-containing protein, putative [Babesia ovis]